MYFNRRSEEKDRNPIGEPFYFSSIDQSLFLVIVFFLGLGLVQVYSSSYIFATESYGDGVYFFQRQLFFSFLGFLSLCVCSFIPWRWIEKGVLWIGLLTAFLLLLTFVPLTSVKVGGASRWIQLPFSHYRFEPGELLKFVVPLIMAYIISLWVSSGAKISIENFSKKLRKRKEHRRPYQHREKQKKSWITCLFFLFLLIAPLLYQPDFGTFVLCILVIFGMFFAFGLRWITSLGIVFLLSPLFYFLVIRVPYRYKRILSFINPWEDPLEKGFQVIQSLLTVRSGGLWGKGLGQGQGKLFFLPEAHTDFTLAVLAEEIGFIGFVLVLCLYAYLFFRGFKVALQSERTFPKAFAFGFTLMMVISVGIHIGVVLGLLPTKGLALPFLSYGGSSLLTTCIGLGLLLNVSRSTTSPSFKTFFPLSHSQ